MSDSGPNITEHDLFESLAALGYPRCGHSAEWCRAIAKDRIRLDARIQELESAMRCEAEFMRRAGYVASSSFTTALGGTRGT